MKTFIINMEITMIYNTNDSYKIIVSCPNTIILSYELLSYLRVWDHHVIKLATINTLIKPLGALKHTVRKKNLHSMVSIWVEAKQKLCVEVACSVEVNA